MRENDELATLGGKTVLLQEPSNSREITRYIKNEQAFLDELETFEFAKINSIDGVLVNGLWAITFCDFTRPVSDEELVDFCRTVFKKHLRRYRRNK